MRVLIPNWNSVWLEKLNYYPLEDSIDYSNNWWYEATEELGDSKVWAFTGSLWPLTLNIVPEIMCRGETELARLVQTEFRAEQVIAELNAQARDIVLSAVAVRQALNLTIRRYQEELDTDDGNNPLLQMQLCKPGIDRLFDLLEIHRHALSITRRFITEVAENVLVFNGGETYIDFRYYCFEGHPLAPELEDKYRRVYEYYGNRLLRIVGSEVRLYENSNPDPFVRPIGHGRACCIDFSPYSGFLLHVSNVDDFMFVPESRESTTYFKRSATRASVGESLIAEGRWTESAVWDRDIPLPQLPPGEWPTPNWNRTEFPVTEVKNELIAQERDIFLSAVAVRQTLDLRIEDFYDRLEMDREYWDSNYQYRTNPLHTTQVCKPGIDRLFDLLDIHLSALRITRQFIQQLTDVNGGTLVDMRYHCFEGHPLQRELEEKYMRVFEFYGGNLLLRDVGSAVGQALIDSGDWTEEMVWDLVPQPRYPEERLEYTGDVCGDDRDFVLELDWELPLAPSTKESSRRNVG